MANVPEIFQQASQLSRGEKADLVLQLLQDLESPDGGNGTPFADEKWRRAWEQEIRSRLDRLDRGETQLLDWDDAIADIRRSLAEENSP